MGDKCKDGKFDENLPEVQKEWKKIDGACQPKCSDNYIKCGGTSAECDTVKQKDACEAIQKLPDNDKCKDGKFDENLPEVQKEWKKIDGACIPKCKDDYIKCGG